MILLKQYQAVTEERTRQRTSREELVYRHTRLFEQFRSTPDDGQEMQHCGLLVIVRRNVFWPCEDSIPLMESVQIQPGDSVLDIGTGSGVIGIFCAKAGAGLVTAVDWNSDAVANAKENAARNKVDAIFDARHSDVFDAIEPSQKFDVITANLPMMNMEARDVVESSIWDTGLRANRIFLSRVGQFIKPGGRIYMTQADFAAIDEVRSLAKEYSWDLKTLRSRQTSVGDTFFAFELKRTNV